MDGFEFMNRAFIFVIGLAVIIAAVAMFWFLFLSQSFFGLEDLFNISNPLGLAALFGILVFGGFYLVAVGFNVLYNVFR